MFFFGRVGLCLTVRTGSRFDGTYKENLGVRQKVRDCAAGSAVMKGVSKDDIHKIQEYLIPTERHREFVDEYYRYAQMAAFPGYTEFTLLVGMGLLGT